MMDVNIKTILLEHSVYLVSGDRTRTMRVDEAHEFGGEFVVWRTGDPYTDLYRGDDFEAALQMLEFGFQITKPIIKTHTTSGDVVMRRVKG